MAFIKRIARKSYEWSSKRDLKWMAKKAGQWINTSLTIWSSSRCTDCAGNCLQIKKKWRHMTEASCTLFNLKNKEMSTMITVIHKQEVCWLYIYTTCGITTTDSKMRSMNDEGLDKNQDQNRSIDQILNDNVATGDDATENQ